MKSLAIGSAVWGLALWGVLKLSDLHFAGTHSICGAWGCGPPVEALIACHGAWLVILTPAAILASLRWSPSVIKTIGWTSATLGSLGIISVVVYELLMWLPIDPEFRRLLLWQRCLFSIGCLTDVPMVEAIVVGFFLLVATRQRPFASARPIKIEIA